VKQEIEGDEAVELNILGLMHHTHSPVGVRKFGNYEAWVDLRNIPSALIDPSQQFSMSDNA
jgi:hypothetical protein